MESKTRKRINRVLSILVGLIFIQSALKKIISSQEMLEKIDFIAPYADKLFILGCIEIIAAIMFMIPRTAILGTLLLIAYMGGAIAINIEQSKSVCSPVIVSAFVWTVAAICNPELTQRILGMKEKYSPHKENDDSFMK